MNLNRILIFGVLGLLTLVGFQQGHIGRQKNNIHQLVSVNKELNGALTESINKFGEAVAQKEAAEADIKLLKQTYGDQLDWIKRHMGINEKNVKGIFNVVTQSTGGGEGRIDTVTVSDITSVEFSDTTQWLQFWGKVVLEPGSFKYEYTVFDDITLVPYKQGKNTFVRGISANPNTRITGLQGILVATDPKKKPWGIGPSIQVGYDTQLRISPGVSIQYSLIRF